MFDHGNVRKCSQMQTDLLAFFGNNEQEIKDRIIRLRRLMLVHSCIYYELNDNVVSDHQWQAWADELEKLQKENPDLCKLDFFDWNFRDWDGATGAHLPHRHPWVYNKARYVIWLRDKQLEGTL